MKKITEKFYCDICGKEAVVTSIGYPVLFLTEQTEGHSCEPYISQTKMDVCDDCRAKIVRVKGYGAQGNNTYEIMEGK